MFLKSITLQGFKSFADRTEISFSDGITAIVGPNGCGKSNVLDAVRWVLGEQSAKSLRGTRMLDVIFSGSRSRKPANFAEVSLRFDNQRRLLQAEAEEVTVGRVLYRNGESEYRLNGEVCRLKDVRDLFLDTGVGVDAYSVIEQGRVDRLLQASPIERREIFEEAAGVSRYKVRRTEAQRKLERTQQNLLRLNDLIDELERQLRSVKLAAAKARKFQEYDGRLRELRSNFALAEYHGLQESQAQVADRKSRLERELESARRALHEYDSSAAGHDRDIQQCDAMIHAAAERLRSLETEIGTLAERAAQGEARIEELSSTRGRRQAQSEDLAQRAEMIRAQIAELAEEVQALVAKVEVRSTKVDELQQSRSEAEARSDAVRRSLEAERVNLFELARRSALLNNQTSNLQQQEQRLAVGVARLEQRQAELNEESARCKAREEGLAEQSREIESSAIEAQEQSRQLEAELAALQAATRECVNELSECKERRSGLSSRLELLTDLDRRHEGIGEGARHLLSWDGAGGVLGLVADLLTVQDPRIAALQHVLARVERHVVVRNADEFFEELARRGGTLPAPVDVIALDRIAASADGDYGTVAGGVTRASEWVSCEPEYRALAEWLLGRVYVVETWALALKRAERAPAGCAFVTPQGEVAAPGGQCTLGPLAPSEGLLSRKAEIQSIQERLDSVERELGERQRRRMELEEQVSDASLKREAALAEAARLQREHAALRTELARCDAEAQRIVRVLQDIESERREIDRTTADLRAQLAELQLEQEQVRTLSQSHESRVADLSAEMDACEQTVALHSQQLTDALVEIGRQAEKRAAAEQSLRELKARLTQLEHERAAAEEEAAQAEQRMNELRADCAEARRKHALQVEDCGRVQAQLAELRSRRAELRRELDSLGDQVREWHLRIEDLQTQVHACEAQQREMAVRQDSVVTRVREELSLDLAELYEQYAHAEQDWEQIRGEIDELRGKIQRLGNVNLDAIQELEELNPRYESMVVQRNDLNESIARLTQLITDLDAESHKRFAEAFNEIRSNFQDLFRKLFGGGRADVILEDPDRPLECGIEVIARPPGKEPQSISLLSGGEKTMTCVALLMAVFKSKPSPFAILDEVDAALDEANVERFSRLLHEFLSVSQFVVITHNKKTMAAADVLYGVTMEEPGVSKRVSVRFDDRVHTPSVA